MHINDPAVLADVTAAFMRYEAALIANDLPVLDELFWDSPFTLRYGFNECLYGYAAIQAFRVARAPAGLARTISRSVITTFGDSMATTDMEFLRPGSSAIGRQSQTWVRMSDGWRVVAAHLSMIDAPSTT